MHAPSLLMIQTVMENKGYAVFSHGAYNLNLVGIRAANQHANEFDDLFVMFYDTDGGRTNMLTFPCTTDPGNYWLDRPPLVDGQTGTAILVPGQYRGAYQVGLHRGQYQALIQTGAKVRVYRDADLDHILDVTSVPITEGFYGINIHRAHAQRIVNGVDMWSAGCQVIQNPKDFSIMMALVNRAVEEWGNFFTYTLLTEEDF